LGTTNLSRATPDSTPVQTSGGLYMVPSASPLPPGRAKSGPRRYVLRPEERSRLR